MDSLDHELRRAEELLARLARAAQPGAGLGRDAVLDLLLATFEATWRVCRYVLQDRERAAQGLDASRPCIEASRRLGLLGDPEALWALFLDDDRQLLVHGRNSRVAAEVYGRVPEHVRVLATWLSALRARSQDA